MKPTICGNLESCVYGIRQKKKTANTKTFTKMSIPEWDLNGSFLFFSKRFSIRYRTLYRIFKTITEITGTTYEKTKRAFRILADHDRQRL